MKTLIASLATFMVLSTGVNVDVEKRNMEILNQVKNSIYIETQDITTKQNKNESIKDLQYISSQLHNILSQLTQNVKSYENLQLRKIQLDQLNVTTFYLMAINDLMLYLDTGDSNYLSDALIEYRFGNVVLANIKIE